LLVTYVAFLYALNSRSDPVASRIAALGREVAAPVAPRAPAPSSQVTLARLLAADIQDGLVEVQDLPDRSIVTLWELFPVGEAQLNKERRPIIGNVARALQQFAGSIVVSGHTDNVPIRSLRFPSNWVLSERRAETVSRDLAAVLPADRLRYEGLGDSKPLVPNEDDASRRINRRVEITLFPQGPAL
jgi:type VI secretion system protein ImpK